MERTLRPNAGQGGYQSGFAKSAYKWLTRSHPGIESQPQTNTVRIFSSSTFVDTKSERHVIMELVEPHLARIARSFGLDVLLCDMRWGVRNEATANHQTIQLCLDQIDKCRRSSTGPYFVFFNTSRSGYRAPPP